MSEDLDLKLAAARAAHHARRLDEAHELYIEAAGLARSINDQPRLAHALRHASDLGRETGHAGPALAHADEAVALYRCGAGGPLDLANALRLRALALETLASCEEDARPAWAEARDLYAAAGAAQGVAECETRLRP